MKCFLIILALSGILMQNFSKVIIFTKFKINQNEIAKKLCEKKDENNNCCKGKCHLKKELKKDDDSTKQPSQNKTKENQELGNYFFKEITRMTFGTFCEKTIHITQYLCVKTSFAPLPIFHPPPFVC